MQSVITGNTIKMTNTAGVSVVTFTGKTKNEIVGSSLVVSKNEATTPDDSGNFTINLVPGIYKVQVGSFTATFTVPATGFAYNIADLITSSVSTTGSIPLFGLPSQFGDVSLRSDGIYLQDPVSQLYFKIGVSTDGGLHGTISDTGVV